MENLSFRWRILFAMWAVLLLGGFAPFGYYGAAVGDAVLEHTREQARSELEAVEWLLRHSERHWDLARLNEFVDALGPRMNVRITFMVHGEVVADSAVPRARLPELDDHSRRPEVLEAAEQDVGMSLRRSATVGRELLYVATLAPGIPGLPDGVLRVAKEMSQVRLQQQEMMQAMFWALPIACVAAVLLSYVLSRKLTQSINTFAESAMAIGQGRYSDRLHAYPGGEFEPLAKTVNTLAESVESQLARLRSQQEQMTALFNGFSEGVLILDERGKIEYWNAPLERMTEAVSEYRSRHILDTLMNIPLHKAVEKVLRSGEVPETISTEIDNKLLEVSITPFKDSENVPKLVLVFRDVSELRRLEQVRRDFTANMSHEMRTPLTNIIGYAETLMDAGQMDPAMANRFLEIIRSSAKQLAKTVDAVMLLSRLEYKGAEQTLEREDVRDAIAEALARQTYKVEKKGVVIAYEEPDEPLEVMATAEGLEIIVSNVLDNAVKHSPENGAIAIRTSLQGDKVSVDVLDQGPGIPRAERARVFERFYRVQEQGRQSKEGSGLGLAICRHMVKCFGGTIWIEDRDDGQEGAAFRITLPVADAEG